ncbi:MAG: C4-type zinc ribbon domain-containing protein [Anaerolineales bacterium]|jgi:predicted  nucleic acid-binding Zn-ribbon protein|nr:C4-type zinc ribbon domain-containing protein [Anaerolineales bacterium]
MSHILGLYRLQQVDSRIDQANARLEAIHAILENNRDIQVARAALEQAKKSLSEAEKSLRASEAASETQQIKLEQIQASLYGGRIQNPKELQDLQNDLASLKRHLATLEDAQLEAMLRLEAARETHQMGGQALQEVETRVFSQNASLKGEREILLSSLENLKAEHAATHSAISPDLLERYEALRLKRRGLAVATISDNACDACGAGLTPGQAQAVRMSAQLIECPSCGRFLFSN